MYKTCPLETIAPVGLQGASAPTYQYWQKSEKEA